MNNKNISQKTAALALVAVMVLGSMCFLVSDESDAATGYSVTDGRGNTVHFETAPAHIATIGTGITATAIQLGDLSKIVVADAYSKTNTAPVFDALRQAISENKIAANGNIYSSGKAALETDLVNAADTTKGGVFDKANDLVIITGSDTYVPGIVTDLEGYGFQKILTWRDITDYADLIGFISDFSLAIDGKVSDEVGNMENLVAHITSGISGKAPKEAFFVTYSSNTFKVGNTGSLANSMIAAAGGVSVTIDGSKSASTYETNLTTIMENHPGAIVFVDNSIASDASKMSDLTTRIGDTTTTVTLNPLWNNYSIASAEGVWTMACAMYPDVFSGAMPQFNYQVTDGRGNTVYFETAPAHIATIGVGVTATAIQLGDLSKIIVADAYSKTNAAPVFDALRQAISENKIAANGNIYSSGKAALETDIINAADTAKGGVFDKANDLVIITGSDTYVTGIVADLEGYGFQKILTWKDVTDYADLIGFVSDFSLAIDGKVTEKVKDMKAQADDIAAKLAGVEKRDAFYVTYSSNTFKVGNTGSLANSMIAAAGGVSVTIDGSKSGSTYEANLTDIMANHRNAVVFVDNSIASDADKLADLKTKVGADATVVALDPLWNNYSIASAEGVQKMAEAMYPDVFTDSPDEPEDNGNSDNTPLYIGAGAVVVILIVVAGLFLMRRN